MVFAAYFLQHEQKDLMFGSGMCSLIYFFFNKTCVYRDAQPIDVGAHIYSYHKTQPELGLCREGVCR